MIESLNRDPFDTVFFFEEEFGKVNRFQKVISVSKILMISDILKFKFGDNADLSNIKFRETEISNNMYPIPIYKVYFITGFCPNVEELIKQDNISIINKSHVLIHFPSLDAIKGSLIVLEDLFNYFFLNKIYISFEYKYNSLQKIFIQKESDEDKYLRLQSSFFSTVVFLLSSLNKQYDDNVFPIQYDQSAFVSVYPVIIMTSLKRYMKANINHLMGNSEFDNSVIKPLIATQLAYDACKFGLWGINFDTMIVNHIKECTELIFKLSELIESVSFRSLDYTHRCITYIKEVDKLINSKEFSVLKPEEVKNINGKCN